MAFWRSSLLLTATGLVVIGTQDLRLAVGVGMVVVGNSLRHFAMEHWRSRL